MATPVATASEMVETAIDLPIRMKAEGKHRPGQGAHYLTQEMAKQFLSSLCPNSGQWEREVGTPFPQRPPPPHFAWSLISVNRLLRDSGGERTYQNANVGYSEYGTTHQASLTCSFSWVSDSFVLKMLIKCPFQAVQALNCLVQVWSFSSVHTS